MGWERVGDQMPSAGNAFTRWIGRTLLRCMGWRIESAFPNMPKIMAVVAPHTSNWDFVIGMGVVYAIGIRASWMAKHTLFKPPFGWLMRYWGGIPINRTASHGVVEQTVQTYASRDQLVLGVTPEGTRKQVKEWKTGFYHMALGAGVPIVLVAFDYEKRVVHFGPTMDITGDKETEMARIKDYFRQFRGKYPQQIP